MSETHNLKSKFFMIMAIMVALAVLLAVFSLSPYSPVNAQTEDQAAKRTVNVAGQGTISATPDIAYVSIGVLTENKDAKVAQQNNANSMDKVISSIKASGVKEEDIQTVGYNINPKYDYNKQTGESNIVGYTVTNTIKVTVRDIKKAGSILDIAADSGANISNSISFGLSDYEKYYNQALKKAMEIAKNRAQTIAESLEIKLKSPVAVTENGNYNVIYNYGTYDAVKSEAAASTPVQAGTLDVTANVSMVYEY